MWISLRKQWRYWSTWRIVLPLKDEELDVIGELMSNISGAIEVQKMVLDGKSEKDALK